MTRTTIVEELEALYEGVHPGTGEILDEESPLRDASLRRTLFAAAVLLKDGRRGKNGPKVPLAERNRALGRPLRSTARWDDEEEERLRDRVVEGAGIREVASELERTPGALVSRLVRLGVVQPSERLLAYDDIATRARERWNGARSEGEATDGT